MVCTFDIKEDTVNPEEIISLLPVWRRQKALSYRFPIDRFLCAKSFLMLQQMLRGSFGLNECPEFSYKENGKPYLKEYPGIFFNISHCRKGIACAVCDCPVGIDIEEIQPGADILDRVLNREERAAVEMSESPALEFTRLWTRKESILKLTGEGIRDDMSNVLSEAQGTRIDTIVNRDASYVLSVAMNEKAPFIYSSIQNADSGPLVIVDGSMSIDVQMLKY